MGAVGASNPFKNVPSSFNINGLQELRDFVGTRSELYNLINKLNPLAVIDKKHANVKLDGVNYLVIMQKVAGGQRLRILWNTDTNEQYYIQEDKSNKQEHSKKGGHEV